MDNDTKAVVFDDLTTECVGNDMIAEAFTRNRQGCFSYSVGPKPLLPMNGDENSASQ